MATSRICSIPDCGKVRARRGEAKRFYIETVLTYDGNDCLIWPFARTKGGYANLDSEYVHRKTCEEMHGPAPSPHHEAAHSCGSGSQGCVTKRHLRWKTRRENEDDKLGHGTRLSGELHGGAKLTDAQVSEIRSSVESGIALAMRFDVSPGHISYVRRNLKR